MKFSVTVHDAIKVVGLMASFVLPLFNIPLVLKMRRRKSSKDLSLVWAIGVWGCILLMSPAAFYSTDIVFKIFGLANLALFSIVVFFVLKYR
jgi:hypothetical protein